jgi:hypothetical protein
MKGAAIVLILLGACACTAPCSAEIEIPRCVVASGGAISPAPAFTLQGTVGQPAVGLLTGSGQVHQVGFWSAWLWDASGLEGREESLPATFALRSCVPNPFRSAATIAFALPRQVRVTLGLYDVRGRLVRGLIDATMAPGFHHAVLEGKGLPAGVYYCRLKAGAFEQTQTLVLVK